MGPEDMERYNKSVRISPTGKGYQEQRYPWAEKVRVTWDNGEEMVDHVKGMNRGHAMARAASNWPSAKKIISLGGRIVRLASRTGLASGLVRPPASKEETKEARKAMLGKHYGKPS
jgi:hypothetical protein